MRSFSFSDRREALVGLFGPGGLGAAVADP
jgi:hypothetical protein